LIFKDRKLNVGPAIRKQVSTYYAAAVVFAFLLSCLSFLCVFSCFVYGTVGHTELS